MPEQISTSTAAAFGPLSKIKANDEQALRALYIHNYPKVEKYILANNGSADDAKDIYQEAFLATWRNIQLDRFTAANDNAVHSYLFQIAKNKWLDALRTRKRNKVIHMPGSELPENTVNGYEPLEAEKEQYIEQVKSRYKSMGDQCRELLKRFYFRKESLREIAAFFSWTEATAKNNKYRCLQKLRGSVLDTK